MTDYNDYVYTQLLTVTTLTLSGVHFLLNIHAIYNVMDVNGLFPSVVVAVPSDLSQQMH